MSFFPIKGSSGHSLQLLTNMLKNNQVTIPVMNNKDYMEKHIRYTHGEKKWYCEKCPNVFTSRERLKVHFDAQHVHATCEICGALVKGLYNMKRHKSVEHDPKV